MIHSRHHHEAAATFGNALIYIVGPLIAGAAWFAWRWMS